MSFDFVAPSLKRRFCAWLLNIFFFCCLNGVIELIPAISSSSIPLSLFIYWSVCATSTASPGKRFLSLFVRREDGSEIGGKEHFIRIIPCTLLCVSLILLTLFKFISNSYLTMILGGFYVFSGFVFLSNYIAAFLHPEHRTLLDLRLRTTVSRFRPIETLKTY